MEETTRMIFWLLGVLSMLAVLYIERKYPEGNPIDETVYWIIGGYIVFVFAWPRGVKSALNKVIDKVWDFSISVNKDND